jgi:hypothetical protein
MAGTVFGSAGLGAPQLSKPPKKKLPSDVQSTPQANIGQWNTPGAGGANWTATNPNAGQRAPSATQPAGAPGTTTATSTSTTPSTPPPPITDRNDPNFQVETNPGDEGLITQAGAQYTTDVGAANNDIFNAAIAYGDPTILAQWGLPTTVDPNSALARAAYAHQQGYYNSALSAESAGNLLSSVHGHDLGVMDTAQANANAAGLTAYGTALGNYHTAMSNAAIKRDTAINAAHQHERDTTPLPTVAPAPTSPAPAPAPTSPTGTGVGAQNPSTLPPGVKEGNVPSTLGGQNINQWWGIAPGAGSQAPSTTNVPVSNWTNPPASTPPSPVISGGVSANNRQYLVPGVQSPPYALSPPAGHPNAKWGGTTSPGANWRGIGGGWYVPR